MYEVNRFVEGTHKIRRLDPSAGQEPAAKRMTPAPPPQSVHEAMEGLKERFPVWMWYKECTADFVKWLKEFNSVRSQNEPRSDPPVAMLGLDIYSLFSSAQDVSDMHGLPCLL